MKNIAQHFDEEAEIYDNHFLNELGMKEFYDEIEYQISQQANGFWEFTY